MFKVFVISLVGSIGGLAVLRGLWLEELGEKEWFKDITDFKLSKAKSHRGLKWVFWGVALETALGFAIAIWEGGQSIKAEIDANANDPRNLPLTTLTASINFGYKTDRIKTNAFIDPFLQYMSNAPVILFVYRSNGMPLELVSDLPVSTWTGSAGDFTSSIHLTWEPGARKHLFKDLETLNGRHILTAGEIANDIFGFKIHIPGLRFETEVNGGTVEIEFNGPKLLKTLAIRPQWTDMSSEINGSPNRTNFFLVGPTNFNDTNWHMYQYIEMPTNPPY